jgi:acyl-CoA thioester hydrolase
MSDDPVATGAPSGASSARDEQMPGAPIRVRIKVPFHDCDPLFVVWHGRYFQYLEVARSALFARHKVDVEDVRALNYRMYVTDVHCRYMHPLSYNDEAEITARFTALTPLLRIAYDVRNLTAQRRSARAVTVLATTDASGKLFPETPHDLLARVRSL